MTLTFDVVATAPDRVKADLLAVPVFTGGLLGPGADVVDAALGGTLAAFMTEAGFEATTLFLIGPALGDGADARPSHVYYGAYTTRFRDATEESA